LTITTFVDHHTQDTWLQLTDFGRASDTVADVDTSPQCG
jgi:hypothetical protein